MKTKLENSIHSGIRRELVDFFCVEVHENARGLFILISVITGFFGTLVLLANLANMSLNGENFYESLYLYFSLGLIAFSFLSFVALLFVRKSLVQVRRMMNDFKGVKDMRTLQLFLIRNEQFLSRKFFTEKLIYTSKEDFGNPHCIFPKSSIPLLFSIGDYLKNQGFFFHFEKEFLRKVFSDDILGSLRYGRLENYPVIKIIISPKNPLDSEEEYKVRNFAEVLQADMVLQNQNVPLFARLIKKVNLENERFVSFTIKDESVGGGYIPEIEMIFEGVKLSEKGILIS